VGGDYVPSVAGDHDWQDREDGDPLDDEPPF
jgi:hypothetical protein